MQDNKRDDAIKHIKETAQIDNVLRDYHSELDDKKPTQWKMDCPLCDGKKKLEYSTAKNIVKCFKCKTGANSAQSYLIKFQKLEPWDSIVEMARIESIDIPAPAGPRKQITLEENIADVENENNPAPKKPVKPRSKTQSRKRVDPKSTFLQRFLDGSGLDRLDITATVTIDDDTVAEIPLYESATVDSAFNIVPGDDVIIHYYDLYGKPVTYYKKNKQGSTIGKPIPFYRIRYASPELNTPDKSGNYPKYRSPYGSGSHIYIPKHVREKFKKSSRIETLYIQEGEKKADKATKHGMISVGVMGIHNIASNQQLPKDFELIIKRCQVENVVFMLDADWLDLSNTIDGKRSADSRPKSFFRAVSNFQKHFAAFSNSGVDLNIYFGHVKENQNSDKGLDDLLTNSMSETELKALKSSTDKALKKPSGDHQDLKFYNITTVSEFKLREFWGLQNIDAFIDKYYDRLKSLKKFKVGRIEWRINPDTGEKEMAQPLSDGEMFYKIDEKAKDPNSDRAVSFNYKRCYTFLHNRGYYRFRESGNTYTWVHINGNIVERIEPHNIKDFVVDFVKELNIEPVENMLYKGAKQYLGSDSLSNLDYTHPNFYKPTLNSQNIYFKDVFFNITDEKIQLLENSNADGQIWSDSILDFKPTLLDPLFDFVQITKEDVVDTEELKPYVGEYELRFTEEGKQCHFMQFLFNTSKFYHRGNNPTLDEEYERNRHFLSKMTAFGYMLHDFRNKGNEYAIVGMDGMMSTVGDSNGRSGKSLFGNALEQIIPTVVMDGKTTDLQTDRFAFEEVESHHKHIFFDDVKPNFIFELLFAKITGRFTIEKKGVGKYTMDQDTVLKFYIATNHALKGDGGSFEDRQRLLGFSSWYNTDWKPIQDFKVRFFDEWDHKQWNLFYNMAALSLHLYLKHGLIKSPQDKLNQRKLRQDIGETFMDWAGIVFANPDNLNQRLVKDELYDGNPNVNSTLSGEGYLFKYSEQKRYTPISKFKVLIKKYCQYRGWEFNPEKEGKDIKSGGREYFVLSPSDKEFQEIRAAYDSDPEQSILDE
jgi:hypothetical protein